MRQLKAVWVDAYHLELYRVGTQGWYAFDEEGDAAVMGEAERYQGHLKCEAHDPDRLRIELVAVNATERATTR